MPNLQQRLQQLRRGARRALIVRGLSWIVVFGFSAMLLSGWIDWVWHIEGDLRLAFGLVTVAGAGWLTWRLLIGPLTQALSDVDLAIKIERRFPGFRDSLASTVQFQGELADPRLGSPELQRRVIAETVPQLESLDLDAVIEHRGVQRAASMAFAVCLAVLVVVGFNQTEAATAVRRMLFPYSAGEWDRITELRLLDDKLESIRHEPGQPFRRVQGDTFRVYVENVKGSLPEDAVVEVKDAEGNILREKLRRLHVRDKEGVVRRLGTVNLLLDRGPMYFRAAGGDDRRMKWHRLEVVPAPRVESFRVTLTPPKYSGKKQESLPPDVGHFRALVGTEVRITAKSRTPLKFARLRLKSDPPREAKLSSDRRTFVAKFRLTEHGNYSYWFELKDRQGFDNPNAPRYDIRAIRDRLPTVRVTHPPRNARVTANAVIGIRVVAEDDLALRDVKIRYRDSREPDRPFESIELNDPAIPYRWQMSRLKRVTEGVQIRFHVEATDHFNLGKNGLPQHTGQSKHVGKSLTRTITIVSEAEKAAEIARNYGSLFDELSRVAKQQRQSYDEVSQLLVQLKNAGKLRVDRDLPMLRRVERAQREINVRLTASGGVEQRALALIDEMRDNKIHQPELNRRLSRIAFEVAGLRRQYLPKIEADLTATRKSADDAIFNPQPDQSKTRAFNPAEQQARLAKVQQGQEFVLDALNELIANLREWRNWHNLSTDLDELLKSQEFLHHRSLILKGSTLGLRASELNAQQKADLAKLAEGQRRIAKRVVRFHKDIGGFIAVLSENREQNLAAVKTLSEAADYVQTQQIAVRMRELSRQIDVNQLGRATSAQEKLISDLREIKAILENRGASDLETLIKKQKAAEKDLAALDNEQEELVKKSTRSDELRKLVKEQEELRKKVNRMASRLRRLFANRADNAMRRARESIGRSIDSMSRNDKKRTRETQQETLDHMQQARRELTKTRAQTEEQLAQELLQRIAGELKGVVKREQNVIEETVRLRKEFERTRRWSRSRLMTLDTLQEEQLALRAKTQSLALKTQAAEVFSRVLRNIGDTMQQAALGLAASQDTPESLAKAIELERAVKERLVKILETLQESASQPQFDGPDSGFGNGAGQNTELISRIKQWKLIKTLQEDTLRATEELNRGRKAGSPLSMKLKKSIDRLANEQSKLIDLVERISSRGSRAVPDAGRSTPRVTPDTSQQNNTQINLANESPILPEDGKRGLAPSMADLQAGIAGGMRSATKRLSNEDTGDETQKQQRKVIKDLEALIRLAEKQLAKSKSSSSKSVASGNPKVKQKNGTKKTGESPMGHNPGPERKKPKDSQADIRKKQQADLRDRIERRQRLVREFWGHLPERERQRLHNVTGDNYIPKYKPQINRYFQSLLED